jgi:UDP-N-acetylenolpyruvoylglucosamine reductase
MGSSLFDIVESVRFMDEQGTIHECSGAEAGPQYRSCALFARNVALSSCLRGRPEAREAIESRMAQFSRKRWDSQPAAPSAGCVFKNPPQCGAGKLVDELGLKGTRFGGAMVSMEHGNFIVNEGGATARDILALIEMIRCKAMAERGVELHTEVQIIGEDDR